MVQNTEIKSISHIKGYESSTWFLSLECTVVSCIRLLDLKRYKWRNDWTVWIHAQRACGTSYIKGPWCTRGTVVHKEDVTQRMWFRFRQLPWCWRVSKESCAKIKACVEKKSHAYSRHMYHDNTKIWLDKLLESVSNSYSS